LEHCGLHRLSGTLALRNTKKAQVKAAVTAIARPATKEEIADICGIALGRLGSTLSSIAGVVRADKKRWGLSEWIEDEYEGIPAEIVQRIEEDGGATRLERLLEELPRMFGVTENSVRMYVATQRFHLRDGYVSLADPSVISLQQLDDTIHGYTDDGLPYWRFRVEERYFRGYSLTGLPPEIVKAIGCEPDGRIRVSVASPVDSQPVSVGWPLASTVGPFVGYLADSLKKLGAHSGEHVLLVINGPGNISFRREPLIEGERVEGRGHNLTADRGRDLLARIEARRRSL